MSKIFLFMLLLLSPCIAFSQSVPSLAIVPFEVSGRGLSQEDAEALTFRCMEEIASWGALRVVGEDQADQADYVIRGNLSRNTAGVVLSATTFDGKTDKALNSAKEEAADISGLSELIFSFCVQAVEQVPFPNFLIGKWEASIPLPNGTLLCRMEFKSNRTIVVEQYDTYENRPGSVLQYHGYGTGSYTYIGHVRKTMALRDSRGAVYRETPVDGSVSISLTLEDALPAYSSLSRSRLYILFDDARTNFELVSAGLLCGENNGGTAVYPQKTMAYTRFTKIQ
ncbi:hypothetical protein [Breznakiella homolactica]|uniref:Uncharacterized protein n=1 Tax=Breznakiella homolactica TaxID=2798577 RepID=A0A7T8B871_9SPIR|nr:hypothetical protein [Breznakiella homolactica]QQO08269.1 hypothetical protein JFL75_15200 [Breznakiella homolactica]